MSPKEANYDRQARLTKVEHLLCQHSCGLTIKQLADLCGVSTRTTRRDLAALEETMGLPVWQDGTRRGIEPSHYLPPIKFSPPEALTILLAVRLYLRLSQGNDPDMLAAFIKLNTIMPERFQEQVSLTLSRMSRQPREPRYGRVLRALCQSFLEGRKCRITYWTMGDDETTERVISPYSIEPVTQERSSYVVGWCGKAGQVRTFKVNRILDCRLLEETYRIPDDFNIDRYLGDSWGIFTPPGKQAKRIVIKFDPDIARYMDEIRYHLSQQTRKLDDGSAEVTLRVAETPDFIGWIMSWGDHAEVLEPAALRRKIKKKTDAMCAKYR